MTEAQFQSRVIRLAKSLGWRVAHFRAVKVRDRFMTPVAADGAGFPDLVLARDGLVIHRELKTDKGRQSPKQREWANAMGANYSVWRPRDWERICLELM